MISQISLYVAAFINISILIFGLKKEYETWKKRKLEEKEEEDKRLKVKKFFENNPGHLLQFRNIVYRIHKNPTTEDVSYMFIKLVCTDNFRKTDWYELYDLKEKCKVQMYHEELYPLIKHLL